MKTKAVHLGPIENPASLANTLNGLPGSHHHDEFRGETFTVERVLQFEVITWQGTLHVVALVEARSSAPS
ncbi:MAG TPA: hypothetical protein VFU88_06360 [Ktedonobacterales bacterium]|nr:hypothetical protein [Ktedonobacterales bacterium]